MSATISLTRSSATGDEDDEDNDDDVKDNDNDDDDDDDEDYDYEDEDDSHQSCFRYLECNIKGELREHLCPDGFVFDINLEKCDYPVKVNCTGRPLLRE